jgi:hypothetical protein
MKAIALLIVLIALAVGTFLNKSENRSAVTEDTVQSSLAAPVREEVPAPSKPQLDVPVTTEIPL